MNLLILFLCLIPTVSSGDVGSFFHVTDFHMDSNYSRFGNLQSWCHAFVNGQKGPDIGQFGNYTCDAPLALINATIRGMKQILPHPDFIIWTGDSLPHVSNSIYNMNAVTRTIKIITNAIKTAFPNTITFPALGNHDYWPASDLPDHSNPVYNAMVTLWASWLQNQSLYEASLLSNYGYYKVRLAPNVTLLVLNTNLYYRTNHNFPNFGPDPGNQFRWFQTELARARSQKVKVVVMGHIPPGAFERTPTITWFRPQYNARFLEILTKYSDVILMNLFGHDHTDSFRILHDNAGSLVGSILIAPAVTPWRLPLPGAGANNPGFRIIDYDRSTWQIIDIHQFYTDLAHANVIGYTNWTLEYSFSSAYNLSPVTTSGLNSLLQKFQTDDGLFQKYFRYNSVSFDKSNCAGNCKTTHLCTMEFVNYTSYENCIRTLVPTTAASTTASTAASTFKVTQNLFSGVLIYSLFLAFFMQRE